MSIAKELVDTLEKLFERKKQLGADLEKLAREETQIDEILKAVQGAVNGSVAPAPKPAVTRTGATEAGRKCSRCAKYKLFSEFYAWEGGPNGHRSECKECGRTAEKTKRENWYDPTFYPAGFRIKNGRKWCYKCHWFKKLDEFPKDSSSADAGLHTYCSACNRKLSSKHRNGH